MGCNRSEPSHSSNRIGTPVTQKQVPVHHFSHHLDAKQDLGFVRAWTRELYAKRSRPSIDPVVFTLQLVTFFEGIRSKRQLIETTSLNLAHRWYLGYTLDEDLHNHSSLTASAGAATSISSSASSSKSLNSVRRSAWPGVAT